MADTLPFDLSDRNRERLNIMKRLISLFVVLAGLGAVAFGQAKSPAEKPASPAAPASKPAKKNGAKPAAKPAKLSDEQKSAVAAIEKLGGKITYDKDQEVAGIDLRNQKVRAEQLAPLSAFPRLKSLVLWGPRITDKALEHVANLTELTDLELDN